jgi:hypothetical protein
MLHVATLTFLYFFHVFCFVGAGDGSADIYDSSIGLLGVENSYIHPYPLLFKYKGSHLRMTIQLAGNGQAWIIPDGFTDAKCYTEIRVYEYKILHLSW